MKFLPFLQPALLMAALTCSGVAVRSCMDAKADAAAARETNLKLGQLNDSTVAERATLRKENSQLAGLLEAERQLHGNLLAAVKIKVPARDTLIVHDTLPTVLHADSSRTATFNDSTFAGTIQLTVTAPPCCRPLTVDSLRIHRPAFEPSIGFVQRDSRTVAVVVWQGERAEIETAFSRIQPPEKRFRPYVEALVDPNKIPLFATGAALRTFADLKVVGRLEQRFEAGQPLRAYFGVRKEF